MTAARTLLVGVGVMGIACGDTSAVVVDISARSTVHPIAELRVRVADEGGAQASDNYSILGDELPLSLTVDTSGRGGALTVTIDAYDADGYMVGGGVGAATIPNSGDESLALRLDPSEITVNTTYAGTQDLAYDSPAFAGRQLAAAEDGSFLVVWGSVDMAMGRLFGPDSRPRVNNSTMNDHEFTLPLSPVVAETQFWPSVTHGPDGYLVAWAETGFEAGMAIWSQALTNADATRLGGGGESNVSGGDGECFPSAVPLVGGGYVVLWVRSSFSCEAGELRGLALDDEGLPDFDELDITTAPGSNDAYPHGAALASGGFVVVWQRSAGDVFARIFSAAGTPRGGELAIATGAGTDGLPFVVATSTGFAIAWLRDGTRVMLQRFDDGGVALAEPVEVAVVSGSEDSRPVVAVRSGDGAFGVAWAAENGAHELDVWFRLLAADGSALGPARVVPNTSTGNQSTPTVAAIIEDAFVVIWADDSAIGPDGDATAVKMRVIYPLATE